MDVPKRLGRYELVARLATGGMGEIFLARLEGAAGFEKLYAIKRILPQFASDARFRKMLIAEAQIASKMSHSNICQVYELGETDGQLFIVMEYLEGVTLLPLLRLRSKRHEPLELGFIANVILQVCDALHYAHELRDRDGKSLDVIHRDISLANVFVCDNGSAKVLDFGIAKVKDTQATQTDTVKGKYAYMAPEQLRGGELTRRVDVFALGVVLYEMIALRRLFQRKTDYLTFHAVIEEPIPEIRRYREDTPDALVAAIARALEREPEQRFESIRQFRAAIADGLVGIRVWSQEEVGELVRSMFSTEIERRTAAVASAIERTQSGQPAFVEQPIASNAADFEDDYEFLAVDTGGAPIASHVRAVPRDRASRSRRGAWIAALIVLLLVCGAVGATVVVMSQQDHQQPPPTLQIEKTDPRRTASDKHAVTPLVPALKDCAAKHRSKLDKTTASISIGPDGRVAAVRFTPASLEAPLAACLGSVLRGATFEQRSNESELVLELTLDVEARKKP